MKKLDTLVNIEFEHPGVLFKPGSSVLTDTLEKIRKKALEHVPDAETEQGRKDIWNLSRKVGSCKAFIDGIGKDLIEEHQQIVDETNKERKRAKDSLTELSNEILKPRLDWEVAEAKRKQGHEQALQYIDNLPLHLESSAELESALGQAEAVTVDESWEEYQNEARDAKAKAISTLKDKLARALKSEEDARELERLKKEEAERKQKEREEELRKEGEERAKAEAEKAKEDFTPPATDSPTNRAVGLGDEPKTDTGSRNLSSEIERKRQINRTILDHLQVAPLLLSEGQAKELVKAIALGKIPHLSIKY